MMRWLFGGVLLVSLLWPLGASGQALPMPIQVYATHDRSTGRLTLSFSNPVSGLVTPWVVEGFPPEALALEQFTVTDAGVIYRAPGTGALMLAHPTGRSEPHPFIPQQPSTVFDVAWVASQDGASVGWAETIFVEGVPQVSLYVADAFGTSITALPAPLGTSADPFLRVRPLALSNDRAFFFYDAAAPAQERPPTEYFNRHQAIYMFSAATEQYQPLPGSPTCPCGFGADGAGRQPITLERTEGGFRVSGSQLPRPISASRPAFSQAGNLYVAPDASLAFYATAQNLEDNRPEAQFALFWVDLAAGVQQTLLGPGNQRWHPVRLIDEGQALLLADVYGGGTYKFNLASQVLSQVSESTWLGEILP
ncbi:MAG: hypothetical protein HC915_03935 [Anaerolineae bacterium]|nr:hypothetical protein [Anaerolineae bacterium]